MAICMLHAARLALHDNIDILCMRKQQQVCVAGHKWIPVWPTDMHMPGLHSIMLALGHASALTRRGRDPGWQHLWLLSASRVLRWQGQGKGKGQVAACYRNATQ
jgi:hypothetical protein